MVYMWAVLQWFTSLRQSSLHVVFVTMAYMLYMS